MIEPELLGHVAIPFNRKQFLLHRGYSFNLKFFLEAGLIAGREESREARHTVFFTLLDPWETRLKKQSTVTFRNQEMHTTKLSGNALKNPSVGFIWPGYRKKT